MKELFVMNARYNQAADKAILSILNGLPNEARNMDRQSCFGGLSGLAAHILGGNAYILGMFTEAVAHNDAALKARAALKTIAVPDVAKAPLSEAQWKKLAADIETADAAYINFTTALSEADLKLPVKITWYEGKPDSVPVFFLLSQLLAHGTHHRGQVSQVLATLKIENDYSGIDVAFMPSSVL